MGRGRIVSVAALAAGVLVLESTLTRYLAVAQYYHFAFLVVSLALLGFGAGGTYLSVVARSLAAPLARTLAWTGGAFSLATIIAYGISNWLPFDSYTIAWDRRQLLLLILTYVALTLPFFFAGVGIGAALGAGGPKRHVVYSANLFGSAAGVVLALLALALGGVPAGVLLAALLGLIPLAGGVRSRAGRISLTTIGLLGLGLGGGLVAANLKGEAPLGMVLSPYKGLVQALRYPGASVTYGRWSATARADVVVGAGTHGMPGLSYAYGGVPPDQLGVSIDADSVDPVTLAGPEDFEAASYLPEALAFRLRPAANVLVLDPGAGLGVLQALAGTAAGESRRQGTVTAVVPDSVVLDAVARAAGSVDPYANQRVTPIVAPVRSYLRSTTDQYDVVFLPLTDPYRPVASGAYGLGETYTLTVEAFEDSLARLAPGGLFVVTRWLQVPPSEDLRLVATVVEALERQGIREPERALVAYRGIQTITLLVQPQGWRTSELDEIREFLRQRRYDLVWSPDVRPEETNVINRLPRSIYYEAVRDLLAAGAQRGAYLRSSVFAISPPTDDHPFFHHFFTWGQTPSVLANLGRTWQPFGGSGYLVLVALLLLVLVLAAALIVAPLLIRRETVGVAAGQAPALSRRARTLVYFGLLGLAYLLVEIPLIQQAILVIGHPTYAFTVVVVSLLMFSGFGSLASNSPRLPARLLLVGLVVFALLGPYVMRTLAGGLSSWPAWPAGLVVALALAPLGTLMGLPFPLGLSRLTGGYQKLVVWAWAVNGSVSVVASVLAALLALSWGLSGVVWLGAAAYALALVVIWPALSGHYNQRVS